MTYGKTYWHNKMSRMITIPVLLFFSRIGSPWAPRNIFILFQVSVSYCPIVAWLVFIFFLGVRFRTPVFDSVLDVVVKFVISTHCSLMKWFIMSTVWKLLKLVFSYPKLFQTSLILLHQSTILKVRVLFIFIT